MEQEQDQYQTIKVESQGYYKDRGSKFISCAIPVQSEEEAMNRLNELKSKYYDARHHCFAYQIGVDDPLWRQNDDGEPSGTAGRPIYGQIMSYELTNIIIVVIRYFGGVKLGVRGLINAYKYAAQDALDKAHIITKTRKDLYKVTYDYPLMNEVMRIIKEENLDQRVTDFGLDCKITFAVRQKESIKVKKYFDNIRKVKLEYVGEE
ncbi:MAG: YigZ family protein [Bacteroidales bacterium]|nr:YigZ family protein [Bacteroidales bacterium]